MEFIENFRENYPLVESILWVLVIATILYTLRRFILNRIYPRLQNTENWYVIQKIAKWINNVIVFVVVLNVFSNNLSGLSTTLGLAGAGITYALREVIVSFAGWFAIMSGDFFKTGDRVLLGGTKGDVIDIGVLRTTLMEIGEWVEGDQYTGRIVRVANSYIFTSPVDNYTADFEFLWDEIHIPIRFSSDIVRAREILMETADEVVGFYNEDAERDWAKMQRKYRIENASLKPQVFIVFDDNWIELSLRYIVDYKERRSVKDRLFAGILEKVKEAGDTIDLASETVEIVRDVEKPRNRNG